MKGAFDELPKCFKTIKSFVKDINQEEDLVPVWKNIGTDEVPIWLTCRGTNLCENYHRVNKTLKLHRFGYDVGNPLYILSLFAYSHQYRFSRLGLDLIEFLFDPVLANDLVVLQAELRDYIAYPPILQGHQLLEDLPDSDHLCSLSHPDELDEVKEALKKIRDQESIDETLNGKSIKFSKTPNETCRRFNYNNSIELKFLQEFVFLEKYHTNRTSELLRSHPDSYFSKMKGSIDNYLKVEEVTTEWNYATLRAVVNQAEDIEFNDKKFPLNCVTLKTVVFIKEGFDLLFGQMHIALEKADPLFEPSIVTTSSNEIFKKSSTGRGEINPTPVNSALLNAPPLHLRYIPAEEINTNLGEETPLISETLILNRKQSKPSNGPAKKQKIEKTISTGTKKLRSSSKKCVQCGELRHDGEKQNCEYYQFYKAHKQKDTSHNLVQIGRKPGESFEIACRRVFCQLHNLN